MTDSKTDIVREQLKGADSELIRSKMNYLKTLLDGSRTPTRQEKKDLETKRADMELWAQLAAEELVSRLK